MKSSHNAYCTSRSIIFAILLVVFVYISCINLKNTTHTQNSQSREELLQYKSETFLDSTTLLNSAHNDFWEKATGQKIEFQWIRSNPILPSFMYRFPSAEMDQKQVQTQQILEPYISLKLAEHLKLCCAQHVGFRGHFLDVGGNFGWFAFLAAASGCDVDTFEPVDWFRDLIETSAEANGFRGSSFNVHPGIVSDTPDIGLTLHIPISAKGLMGAAGVDGMNRSGMKTSAQTLKLEKKTTTIDAIGITPKHHSCGMKVDVEGFEPKVLAGGKQFIAKHMPPMIILEFSPGMSNEGVQEMITQLKETGYKAHIFAWGTIKSKDPSIWVLPLSTFSFELDTEKLVRKCGYNCMMILVQ